MSAPVVSFRLALTYARRELRAGLSGLYVFLACLALGVGAIAAVQSLSLGLTDSLRHDGRAILGGDLAAYSLYKPQPPAVTAYLKTLGRTTRIFFAKAMTRTDKGDDAALTDLKAVEASYPLYGAYQLADGTSLDAAALHKLLSPASAGGLPGALAEESLLSRLHVKPGDTVKIGRQAYVLRGVVGKEPDRISAGDGFMLAPRVLVGLTTLAQTGLLQPGSRTTFKETVALHAAADKMLRPQDLQKIENAFAEKFPEAGRHVRDCYRPSGSMDRLISRLTFFLTLIGLTTLLVGGVGVSNAVRGFLDTRLAHIATLKSLGASGAFVQRLYIVLILLLAAFGIALGLAMGAGAALLGGSLVTAKLSLTDSTGIYPAALLTAAAFGFLVTLAFSLWPVGRAVSVTPADLFRESVLPATGKPSGRLQAATLLAAVLLAVLAIASASDKRFALNFVGGAVMTFTVFFGCSAWLKTALRRLSAKALRLPPGMRMAMANLYRPGNVTTGVILSLGIGLTVLIAIAQVEYNLSRLLAADAIQDAPSFFFLDVQKQDKAAFEKLVGSFAGTRKILTTPSFRGRIVSVNGVDARKALVDPSQSWVISSDRGFTFTDTLPQYSRIVDGKWWGKDYRGAPLVSIATNVARAFNIGAGDRLTVNILGMDITATVASVREVDWTSFTLNFAVTFAPGALDDAPYSIIATAITPDAEQIPLQNAVAKQFPGVTVIRVKDVLETAGVFVSAIAQAIRISAFVTLLAGMLVLAGGVAAARRRHVYDAVILKVLGATRARILKTFLLEYALLGAMTVFIAAALGTLASYAMLHFILELHWTFSFKALAGIAALSLGMTLLAGFFGTWRALRQKPAPYLRNP
jgi:putative ABC transport system permease protein